MASKVLVVGSGAIGLRTALELLRRNVSVRLRSTRPPLDPTTCSMGAGGLWMPYHCDDKRVDRWAVETLDELLSSSAGSASSDSGRDAAVEIVPTVVLKRHHHGPTVEHFIRNDERWRDEVDDEPLPRWTKDERLAFQHLSVEMLWWQNRHVHGLRVPSEAELTEAGYKHAWLFNPPIVDAPRMLMSMLAEVERHPLTEDMDVETGAPYESLQHMADDAARLDCDAVVNCTGLGSRDLCGDAEIIGGRGVLLHYHRRMCRRRADMHGGDVMPNDAVVMTEEAPWGSEEETCYLIPRGDVLCVGGTYLEGDEETGVREGERERLRKNAWRLGIDTERSKVAAEWTGFRPCRPTVRLEVDADVGVKERVTVVHNYGHGGSGWTVFVGAAREVASLLQQS